MRKIFVVTVGVVAALTFSAGPAAAKTAKPSSTCRSALAAADSLAGTLAIVFSHTGDYFTKLGTNATDNSRDITLFISTLSQDTSDFSSVVKTDQADVAAAVGTYKEKRDACLAGK